MANKPNQANLDQEIQQAQSQIRNPDEDEREAAATLLAHGGFDFFTACPRLRADHFGNPKYRLIFEEAEQLQSAGRLVDATRIWAQLATNEDKYRLVGGKQAIHELIFEHALPSLIRFDTIQDRIIDAHNRRHLITRIAQVGQGIDNRQSIDNIAAALSMVTDEASEAAQEGKQPIEFSDIPARDRPRTQLKPQWMIRDIVPTYGTIMLRGGKNAGKSAFTYTLAAYIAANIASFADRTIHTDRLKVIYVDAEADAEVYGERMRGIIDDADFSEFEEEQLRANLKHIVVKDKKILSSPSLVDFILQHPSLQEIPAIIFVDTFGRASGAENESDNAEMIKAMSRLDELASEFKCPVWINSHPSKAARQMKGSTITTRGASGIDDQAYVTADLTYDPDDGARTFAIQETRNVPNRGWKLQMSLERHQQGIDTNGDPHEVPVLRDLKWLPASESRKKGKGERNAEELCERLIPIILDPKSTAELVDLGFERDTLNKLRARYQTIMADKGIETSGERKSLRWRLSER